MANYDDVYGTGGQVDFAKEIAKHLLTKKRHQMSPGMAVLPGSWRYGVSDIVDTLAGTRYRDIAGKQDLSQRKRMINPSYQPPQTAPQPSLMDQVKKMFGGGQALGDKSLTTGSLGPPKPPTPPGQTSLVDEKVDLGPEGTPESYPDEVKRLENEKLFSGKEKESRAQWDFKQHTIGFGTKANPNEVGPKGKPITAEEAHNRFATEWAKAQEAVDKFNPGLPRGPRAALTSLTFNSGTNWMKGGLGAAVQANDPDKAKELFLKYNGVIEKDPETGQNRKRVLAALDDRRKKEAKWFDDVTPVVPQTPNNKMTGMMRLGGPQEDGARPGPQGEQLAQAFTATPSTQPSKGAIQNVPGGYSGVVPPAAPLESQDQLEAAMLAARNPEDAQKIKEDYMKRAKGDMYETQGGGKLIVTPKPGGEQPIATHIPGADIPLGLPGLDLKMRQNPKGGFDLILPGGGAKGFNSINDLMEYARQQKAKDITAQGTASEQVKHYQTEQQTIQNQGEKSKLHIPQLNIIQKIVKDPSAYVGVGADKILDAKKVLDALGMTNDTLSQPAATEVLQKLMATSNLAAMEQLRGFGQVRSTDLDWIKQSNAAISNRPEAITALTDMAKRMHTRSVDIQKLAQEYRDNHNGNLDSGWDKHLSQWTTDHPLFTEKDMEEYKNKIKEKVTDRDNKKRSFSSPQPLETSPIRRYVPGKGWE